MAKLPTSTEIRKMSIDDLRSEVATVRRDAARIRLGVEINKEKDASQMKKLRRHLARVLTVLQEKQVGGKTTKAPKANTGDKPLSKTSKTSKIPARA